ncbi:efflux RND transporter periplasmic adaptor subunit [Stakelama tenebrarum]|uniref:Efflux RND transporter periplasmic adaptor subunit n=1 Tax=Stakelama tenebrarum TaxID=2711215 RepID=A0A6G6Y997_9SPHN|nr:efflux RND transporter periplasmic adaptor subunit [Sphingosinithalassobacter tenebrarum]QIG81505.1 efflux RND transporter periplasmic adaptor subunit [Sphingosinithalassobacter tenebrarum]
MADDPELDEFLGAKRKPRWRRFLSLKWISIAIGVLLLLLLIARCMAPAPPPSYATAEVQRGQLNVTVSATGKLAPTNQVDVGSEISGLVDRVLVEVNDRVTKGQPLAVIDPSRLDDQIRQGEASLNANVASVAQQRATLQEAQAQLARMQEVERLSGGRVPSKTEMESAEAAVARARANLRAAQANVASAQASLSASRTERYKAVIRSPVNGVVLARQVDAGQTVAASFNVATLFVIAEDLTSMKLEVAVDEADVGEVAPGQKASFTVDAFPGRTFPAEIQRVDLGSNLSAQGSSSTTSSAASASQVVSYAAVLTVDNPDLILRPGMTATATIQTDSRDNVLLIPNGALRFKPSEGPESGGGGFQMRFGPNRGEQQKEIGEGSRQTIYVLGEDGKPQPVQVVTGASDGSRTEVRGEDLKAGMQVIVGVRSAAAAAAADAGDDD